MLLKWPSAGGMPGQGGSVSEAEKARRGKKVGSVTAAGKMGCNSRKAQGKMVYAG
ncbi:hypothetical protein [Rosenbergiella nectarea]|uniref:hypothetical protein n=1 Tax=Rosenbergiella nectarea TaxID=988801 RepID=UPI001F4E5251|nr:hypothetical protein [Rosenbergiella nectarea]